MLRVSRSAPTRHLLLITALHHPPHPVKADGKWDTGLRSSLPFGPSFWHISENGGMAVSESRRKKSSLVPQDVWAGTGAAFSPDSPEPRDSPGDVAKPQGALSKPGRGTSSCLVWKQDSSHQVSALLTSTGPPPPRSLPTGKRCMMPSVLASGRRRDCFGRGPG